MDDSVLYEFAYRPKPVRGILRLLMTAATAVVCLYVAIDPPAEDKDAPVTQAQFQVMMGAVAALAAVVTVGLAAETLAGMFRRTRVALTADAILLPGPDWQGNASVRKDEMQVPYDEIRSVKVQSVAKDELKLQIVHTYGTVSILSKLLPTRQAFDRLAQMLPAIVEECQAARLAEQSRS